MHRAGLERLTRASRRGAILYIRSFTTYLLAVAAFLAVAATPARAWWGYGHETITQGVLQDLSGTGDLNRFIGETDAQFSAIPHIEPAGNHFINIDTTATTSGNAGTVSYGSDFTNFRAGTFTFPTTTAAANARYGSTYISTYGGVPWLANDTLTSLTAKMQAATTYADWYHLLPTAGALAHYIEDLHQPLHITTNYNPGGLHGRYEGGEFEDGSVVRYPELLASMTPVAPTYFGPTTGSGFITRVFNRIPTDYDKIQPILNADAVAQTAGSAVSPAYFDSLYSQTKTLTEDSFQDAANVIGSALYTAYINAGSPQIPQATFYATPAKQQSTITAKGPVTDYTNQDFFAVTQNEYGVARFSTAAIKAQYDARFGAGHWAIDNVALTVENIGSNNAGTMNVFYSADDSTNIEPGGVLKSTDNGAPLGVNVTTDTPLLHYNVAGSETNFSFSRFDSTTPQAFNFSPLTGDILSGNDVTLLLAAASSTVRANYYGGSGLSLEVSAHAVQAAIAGDYNHDGVADGADYILWRDTLGQSANLAADGNNNGTIDSGDYDLWRAHFGQTAGAGASQAASVPEPSSLVLVFLGLSAFYRLRVKKPSARENRGHSSRYANLATASQPHRDHTTNRE